MKHALWLAAAPLLFPTLAHAQQTASPTPTYASPMSTVAAPTAPAGAATSAANPYATTLPAFGVQNAFPDMRRRPYHGGRVPTDYHVESFSNRPYVALGAAVLGALWAISATYALVACPPGANADACPANTAWLYIPVIGPFFTAAASDASFGGRNLSIFDGVLQTGALITLVAGLLSRHRVLAHDEVVAQNDTRRRHPLEWHVLPVAAGANIGASLSVVNF